MCVRSGCGLLCGDSIDVEVPRRAGEGMPCLQTFAATYTLFWINISFWGSWIQPRGNPLESPDINPQICLVLGLYQIYHELELWSRVKQIYSDGRNEGKSLIFHLGSFSIGLLLNLRRLLFLQKLHSGFEK